MSEMKVKDLLIRATLVNTRVAGQDKEYRDCYFRLTELDGDFVVSQNGYLDDETEIELFWATPVKPEALHLKSIC